LYATETKSLKNSVAQELHRRSSVRYLDRIAADYSTDRVSQAATTHDARVRCHSKASAKELGIPARRVDNNSHAQRPSKEVLYLRAWNEQSSTA
jgi:hypothetical protein